MTSNKALIVVDVQRDFCEGGSLEVTGGAAVAAKISRYIREHIDEYELLVFTQDWHKPASSNGGHFSAGAPDYKTDWPEHCVAGTDGAKFHPNIEVPLGALDKVLIFRKGWGEPAYSGFEGKLAHYESTLAATLGSVLQMKDVGTVDVCGLASDYCVKATVLDAAKLGLTPQVLVPLTAGVALESTKRAMMEMRAQDGVTLTWGIVWAQATAAQVTA